MSPLQARWIAGAVLTLLWLGIYLAIHWLLQRDDEPDYTTVITEEVPVSFDGVDLRCSITVTNKGKVEFVSCVRQMP